MHHITILCGWWILRSQGACFYGTKQVTRNFREIHSKYFAYKKTTIIGGISKFKLHHQIVGSFRNENSQKPHIFSSKYFVVHFVVFSACIGSCAMNKVFGPLFKFCYHINWMHGLQSQNFLLFTYIFPLMQLNVLGLKCNKMVKRWCFMMVMVMMMMRHTWVWCFIFSATSNHQPVNFMLISSPVLHNWISKFRINFRLSTFILHPPLAYGRFYKSEIEQ